LPTRVNTFHLKYFRSSGSIRRECWTLAAGALVAVRLRCELHHHSRRRNPCHG
jgi:hypothetical protein